MYFVSYSIYKKARNLAEAQGDPYEIIKRHEESREIQSNAKYIPASLLYDLYEWCFDNLDDNFSVMQGTQMTADDYGTLGLSWKTCWKAREVLDRTLRFMTLITDQGSLEISDRDNLTVLKLVRDTSRKGHEIGNEVGFVVFNKILNEVTDKEIRPVSVHFKHKVSSLDSLKEYFECPVYSEDKSNLLVFKTEDLNMPTVKADRSINHFITERMNEELSNIQTNSDQMLKNLHQLLKDALPSGVPSVVQAADHLGMSTRTLNRRLSKRGLTFRSFLQDIQKSTSQSLLKNTPQSIGEVAFQVGFSEQSAFNRAFKRWTGVTPIEYRKQV
jgi:AraC-like DNA-binding protein